MPRRYYRSRTRVIRPKKKWGSNIKNFSITTSGNQSIQANYTTLVQNSVSTSNPTPVIIKAGNFKVQGDAYYISSTAGNIELSLYVIYLPEGVNPADATAYQGLITAHPEWVLAWKFVSANRASGASTEQNLTFSFSSRLKRNLNSGDKIVLLGLASAGSTSISSANFTGMCQYWTCTN